MQFIVFVGGVAALFGFLWSGGEGDALARRAEAGERLAATAAAPAALTSRFLNGGATAARVRALEVENQNLRAQLHAASLEPVPVNGEEGARALRAKRYSTYPFNHQNLVIVGAGAEDGVAAGAAVTVESHLFLGVVSEVHRDYSVVRTVFDDGMKLAVKIGEAGVEALFLGGRNPRLTLIAKDAALSDGAAVWTADRKVPFGLLVGELTGSAADAADAFQEAALAVPYDLGRTSEVVVRLP